MNLEKEERIMFKSADEWIVQYKKKDAFWIHDGNPKRPHVLLDSGKHSDGFFNSRLVMPDGFLLSEVVSDLLEILYFTGGEASKIEGVVGPQSEATKLAQLFSSKIKSLRGDCFWASPEKITEEDWSTMVFSEEDQRLLPDKNILLCDDVLSTGSSVALLSEAVTDARGHVLPFIVVLVNRSGREEINGKKIVSLINHPMSVWEPNDCLLCQKGSEVVNPEDNWALLNAFY